MIFFVSVSIPLGFCNPIIPILDIGYTPFDHFYIWAIDHLLNGMHTTTTTCSVSRCHPPHRPNHLAWQWTIWTMDGFEKKNYRKLWVFGVFFFTAMHDSTRTPLQLLNGKKHVFLLAFLGVSWFSCKFSHHPRLQRLPRLPFGRGEEFWEALSQRFCPKIRASTKDDWKIWPWTMELYGIMGACNF